jgi:hypothetical protein
MEQISVTSTFYRGSLRGSQKPGGDLTLRWGNQEEIRAARAAIEEW